MPVKIDKKATQLLKSYIIKVHEFRYFFNPASVSFQVS